MTQSQAEAVLVDAIRTLRPRQRARLLEHERCGTPILSGPDTGFYYSRAWDGAGTLEALAATRHIPRCCDQHVRNRPHRWERILDEIMEAVDEVYLDALAEATPATVRAAIRRACTPVARETP